MENRDELIFWFDQPPQVSKGAFNYVSEHWGNKVLFIADHHFPEHRKQIGWDNGDYGNAEMLYISDQQNETEFIKDIFDKYPNAVHILNGFFSNVESKIYPFLNDRKVKLVVHTERPFIVERPETIKQILKNVYLPIKYKQKHKKYKNLAKAIMPLGIRGCNLFEKTGWKKDQIFSFMYCPILSEVKEKPVCVSDPIKFLYVGRFDKKRMYLLQKAVDKIKGVNWHIDMVGGYGDYAEQMKNWINTRDDVSFLGKWDSSEVGKKMQDYDVYILPAKWDGWNAQVNEAINAGIALVSTSEAVSDELVTAANAGLVVPAYDVNAFSNALYKAATSPDLVKEWKNNALVYKNKISGNVVGNYFIDILDYIFYDKQKRPICPWL